MIHPREEPEKVELPVACLINAGLVRLVRPKKDGFTIWLFNIAMENHRF